MATLFPIRMRIFFPLFFLFFWFGSSFSSQILAHPMPYTTLSLQIQETKITGDVRIPISELQTAIGFSLDENAARLLQKNKASWKTYLLQHIQPKTLDGKPWHVAIHDLRITETVSALSGNYLELAFECQLTPPKSYDLRHFYLGYEAVLREVASHKALISIQHDWRQGIFRNQHSPKEIGMLEWDIQTGTLKPFLVNIDAGSPWNGFKEMIHLGMEHISEGTDHLLFLFLLLLPIPFIYNPSTKKNTLLSIREGSKRILYLVSSFTLGHSVTLFIGGMHILTLPTQIIETLIGISILLTAIHVMYPIFPNKEKRIAFGFGLVHGLAFATTLDYMQLGTKQQMASIFGFNLGIELMQLAIISAVLPGLFLLSRTAYYRLFRNGMAVIGFVAGLGWITERITNSMNMVTTFITHIEAHILSIYLLFLAFSAVCYFLHRRNRRKNLGNR